MGADQRQFFDELAPRWDSLERADIRARLDRVVREAGLAPGARVLDVGTGTGVLIDSLLRAIGPHGCVDAIDISPGMLEQARDKAFPQNVRFHLADALDFQPAGGAYDWVLCNAVLPHFNDKPLALRHLHSLLRPGGAIAVSHPTGRAAVNAVHAQSGAAVAADRVPAAAAMRELLEAAGFTEVHVTDEAEFYLAIGRKPE